MDNMLLIIIFMGLVTYLPRMLPVVLLNNLKLPPFLESFFSFIPFAALGALIFPGILNSTGNPATAVAGGVVAVVLGLLRLNVTIVVFGGILGVYLFDNFFFYK
ncbi:MAG: AzlD domain-containing protein [Firmicutes bacterium]|nr:AzlD domain-containing protein [Bacillota bacterium]